VHTEGVDDVAPFVIDGLFNGALTARPLQGSALTRSSQDTAFEEVGRSSNDEPASASVECRRRQQPPAIKSYCGVAGSSGGHSAREAVANASARAWALWSSEGENIWAKTIGCSE